MTAKITISALIIGLAIIMAGGLATEAQAGSAPQCTTPSVGLITGYLGGANMNQATVTNHSRTCAYKVGVAAYKAYLPYTNNPNNKDWIFTQTYYASKTIILQPGQTWRYTIAVPGCAYQTDIYWGDTLKSFPNITTTYSGQHRYLDGWYQTSLSVCTKPTPSLTPTPMPTATPTPTPTEIPTPTVLGVSSTPTPPAQLPDTGPGNAVVFALAGPIVAFLGRKYYLSR